MAKQSLNDFIHDCFTDEVLCKINVNGESKMTEPTAMVLVHVKNGFKQEELDGVTFGSKRWDLNLLAERFEKKADHYAQALPGVQTFILKAFWADKREPKAQQPFTVTGQLSSEHDGLMTEAPTSTGITQQTMRHLEAIMQTFHQQTALILDASTSMMQVQSQRENKLRNDNDQMFATLRDLLMQNVELNLKGHSEELARRQRGEHISKLLDLAPPLINSITGKEVFPEAAEDTALIDSLAKRLTPDMLRQLTQILPNDLLGPLAHRFKKTIDQENGIKADGELRITNGLDTDKELS